MYSHHSAAVSERNDLLSILPVAECERLQPHLTPLSLAVGQVLHQAGKPAENVYFPCRGVVSLVLTSREGTDVEVSLVGREGMVGAGSLMGDGIALTWATVQVAGGGWSLPAQVLRDEFKRGGVVQDLMLQYLRMLLAQTAQVALCNRLHTVEERLSRWLLMVQDRVQSESFDLTQEIIAEMLGVRRPGVTVAAGALRQTGLIRYSRGHITILDREGLEDSACECYTILRRYSTQLFDDHQVLG